MPDMPCTVLSYLTLYFHKHYDIAFKLNKRKWHFTPTTTQSHVTFEIKTRFLKNHNTKHYMLFLC